MLLRKKNLISIYLCLVALCVSQSVGREEFYRRENRRRLRHRSRFLNRATEEKSEDTVAILPIPEQRSSPYGSKNFWVTDGSKQISVDGNTVTSKEAKSGETYSAMWKDVNGGVNKGEHYWEVYIDSIEDEGGSISVGLTNPSEFKKGRGLLYSGNLENGRESLISDYGPRFKFGDTIGILASFVTKGKLKIYFYYNKRSLGLAYDVDSSILPNAQPVVQFGTSGVASIVKETEIPKRRTREAAQYSGIEGDWKIIRKEVVFNGKPFYTAHVTNEDNPHLVTLQMESLDDNNYSGALSIVNDIRFNVKSQKKQWKMSQSISTKKGVTDYHLRVMEENLTAMTNGGMVNLMRRHLILEKGDNKVAFERYEPIVPAVSKNPFVEDDVDQCFCPCSQKSR